MGLLLSSAAQYAIRTLVHLAQKPAAEAVPIRTIAEEIEVSYPFLAKVVSQLAQKGFVDSFKGPRGGIRLARAPHRVDVWSIVAAIDGAETFQRCFLGLAECGEDQPCPLHDDWGQFRDRLRKRLASTTLSELATVASSRREPID